MKSTTIRVVNKRQLQVLVDGLLKIATYGDIQANNHLKSTGSYGLFDEPNSVQIARDTLKRAQQ